MINKNSLVLDLKTKLIDTNIVIPQGDTGTQVLSILLLDNGREIDLSQNQIEFAVLKQDRNFIVVDNITTINPVEITLPANATAAAGKTLAEIRIKEGEKILTTAQFSFYVRETIVNNGRLQSTTEYKALEDLTTKAAEVSEKIKVAIKSLDNVEEIKAQLKEINDKIIQAKQELETKVTDAGTKTEELTRIIGEASTVFNNWNSKKAEIDNLNRLLQDLTALNNALINLNKSIDSGTTLKTNLDSSIDSGTSTKNNLDSSITTAREIKDNVDQSTNSARATKRELDNSQDRAIQTDTSLKANISSGDTLNRQLVDSTATATEINQTLQSNTQTATGINDSLSQLISQGKATKDTLVTTIESGKVVTTTLESLLERAGATKTEIEKIIAQGNLSEYITTVTLDEKLKVYATKEDLTKIDVTSQLTEYAKKTELSNKVDKVSGKGLSTNDFTNEDKTEVAKIKNKADKSSIPVNLSQLQEDDNHKTITSVEKNKVQSIPDNPKYTDTIYNDTEIRNQLNTKVNKSDYNKNGIGLGNVSNYGIATQEEAEQGTSSTKYMTPERTKQAIQRLSPAPDLTKYATKEDLTKIDVTSQLTEYAKKTELSNKVDKVTGKSLSSNDFANSDKQKLSELKIQKILTQSEYNALSNAQKNDEKYLYFIKQ